MLIFDEKHYAAIIMAFIVNYIIFKQYQNKILVIKSNKKYINTTCYKTCENFN